jgi:Fe-S oxidoreductase
MFLEPEQQTSPNAGRLENFRHTMESCNHCGQCKWILGPKAKGYDFAEICPIHLRHHFDAYSGQGLINIAQELLDGDIEYEPGLIDLIYSCTTCGACDVNCKSIRDMEVLDLILALRERCVADGQGPKPVHEETAKSVRAHHNLYGRPHTERSAWADRVTVTAGAKVAYFAGCAASYVRPEIARDTARILNAGGLEFTLLGEDEQCCGGPLWRTGQRADATRQAEHNIAALAARRIDTVVTSCAECLGTFRGFYPRVAEVPFKTVHVSEVIAGMLKAGRLKLDKPVEETVTYHDPCMLGRLSEPYVPWTGEIVSFGYHEPPKPWRRGHDGVYDAPREVLRAIPGLRLVEMTRNEENAFCCGGGGGVAAAFPDLAEWTAAERLREVKSTGASAVCSACPFCQSTFEGAIGHRQEPVRYYDLTSLVAKALGD